MSTDAVVIADHPQLHQVFMNLCLNARDAMPHGGDMTIEVSEGTPSGPVREGRFVRISISDTGIGMPPHVRDRMFEPFFSTKGEGKGTGLGLATAYGIIRGYGGTIDVESAPGRGTRVDVFLPAVAGLVRPTPAPTRRTVPLRESGKGHTILLAEDQDLVRRQSRRLLERLGYKVVEACDGLEAVELIQAGEEDFSLALLDLQMPRQSGDEACRCIRRISPDLPIVMVSGNVEDPRIESLVGDGLVGVLAKPFGVDELADAIATARSSDEH
jgi:CheY-like chemotaxis protein